jgi:soluble lytic murein transglycosylase-like protein
MRRVTHAIMIGAVAAFPGWASGADPATACAAAAAAAESRMGVPHDLIAAIGRVESGRRDAQTGRVLPWPWTVNANGAGLFFANRDDAVRHVRELQARGVRRIDVGCFQVDLFYHPQAFDSLEDAFDPAANADYAARFLLSLYGQNGNWPAAVARYHSAAASEGDIYRQKVMVAWRTNGTVFAQDTTRRWSDPPSSGATPDRYVVLMSAEARAIHVIRP